MLIQSKKLSILAKEKTMFPIIAGCLAAFLAWGFNKIIVKFWGDPAIVVLVPVGEEILKTSLAFIFSSSIIYTHITFGLIEAIWDIKTNAKGLQPGLFSVLTHSIFGLITWLLYSRTGYISISIMTGIFAHIIWNSYIIKLSAKN